MGLENTKAVAGEQTYRPCSAVGGTATADELAQDDRGACARQEVESAETDVAVVPSSTKKQRWPRVGRLGGKPVYIVKAERWAEAADILRPAMSERTMGCARAWAYTQARRGVRTASARSRS